jgi:hypothetical protein
MRARMFSTIANRRSERPLLVSWIGYGFCTFPLIIAIVLLIALPFSSFSAGVDGVGGGLALAGFVGVLSGLSVLLGYGLLALKRLAYWATLVILILGGASYLLDLIQAGTFSPSLVMGVFWIGYLLQPSVRRAFRY